MQLKLLDQLRQQNPVVLNISNFVTVQDVANGLNAIGASPIMSQEIAEAEPMVKMAGAVQLNLGTLTKVQIAQTLKAGELANQFHKPIVLDPVAVGAVNYRLEVAQKCLTAFHADIIRGNAGEVAALGGFTWNAKGIDAGEGSGNIDEIAKATAQKYHCVVISSGATDTITDGKKVVHVNNGTPLFQVHVGSGDMLSSITAAFAAISPDNLFEAAQTATLVFGAVGELVAQEHPEAGPGTFAVYLMDYLAKAQVADLEKIVSYD
ncbi:hydroxyethylthiazole kinase [Lactobacillus sp. ESL0791]|uniref:hydroxyethylthiazole kinase n=1 Tax=Lactobacillus sp. ESL0791 TaxID=2983234 RepID=UPI0023F9146C|nr:hydroxyethylthiazole kinase [Lactobacillus sp. ESL0791]MDF7638016.1 hydroxyethylthiazole kinase [Lactobacillus sp. ESL0791]